MKLTVQQEWPVKQDSCTDACGNRCQDGFKMEHARHKTVDDHLRQEAHGRDSRDTQLDTLRFRPRKGEGAVLPLGWLDLNMQLPTTVQ